MFGYYYDASILILLPALILAIYAQFKVQSTYNRYSQVYSSRGYTGAQVARHILDSNGLYGVVVEQVSGTLSDHYDPRSNAVRLSEGVYGSNSIAAVGVAAHECGHAVQHATGYTPLKFRNAIVPVTNIGSKLSIPILLIGLFLNSQVLILVGCIGYALMALFQLLTLPVEFNASSRALAVINQDQLLVGEEYNGAKKVLQAAALTYVAALISALAQLLRLLSLAGRRRR
ncbi:MAG: zinc metallopeptidase [Oscillospiraceae bacterium]